MVRGIAPSATLISVGAFPLDRGTQPQMTTTFVLLRSLELSVANGARVLTLRLAGPRDPLIERAVAAAAARDVILIAAAGNNGDKAPPAYPAACPEVIVVITAIDARDELYARANRGRYIAIAAPGVDVLAPACGNGHDLQSGTSFAAAHVSGVLALLIADAAGLHGVALAVLLGVCALAHVLRLLLWQPWRTLRTPLVWVLHAAYLWIVLHLALRGLAELGWVAASLAAHALTVGAVGSLTLGMMIRTSRGHTARELRADGVELACFLAVNAAALLRVGLPLAVPAATMMAVLGSALLWCAAFALFTLRYWPILTRARLDGKPG